MKLFSRSHRNLYFYIIFYIITYVSVNRIPCIQKCKMYDEKSYFIKYHEISKTKSACET